MYSFVAAVAIVVAVTIFPIAYADTWAISFTASDDVLDGGYRHQADAYRFTQLLLFSGLSEDHIIHMNPDTARTSYDNPTRYYLFTEPNCTARDVTYNTHVNYNNEYVNVTSFKRLIGFRDLSTGLLSDIPISDNDTIIYYIVGHGNIGVIQCKQDYIFYDDIIEGLDKLLASHYYLHIFIIIDTCYAGSIFNATYFSDYVYLKRFNRTFDHDINVIAATDSSSSSYGWYCEEQNILNRFNPFGNCLTDEFSKQVMDFIQFRSGNETIHDLFYSVKTGTTLSPVTAYGKWNDTAWNRTISDVFQIGTFIPQYDSSDNVYSLCSLQNDSRRLLELNRTEQELAEKSKRRQDLLQKYIQKHPGWMTKSIPREEERLRNLELRANAFEGRERVEYSKLYNEERVRKRSIDNWVMQMTNGFKNVDFNPKEVYNWECYHKIVNRFENRFGHSTYGMSKFRYLVGLCNRDKKAYLYLE